MANKYTTFKALREGIPRISGAINANLKGYARASAERVKENAQGLLGHDQPFWEPITEETLARRQENDSPGPLLDTGLLRDSIIVVVRRDQSSSQNFDIEYAIGVSDSAVGMRDNGQAYFVADTAFALEFGGSPSQIPPRPFLRTALMMERDSLRAGARGAIRSALDAAIEEGGPVTGYNGRVNVG